MPLLKAIEVFVIANAMRTHTRPKNHNGSLPVREFAAKAPGGTGQIRQAEIRSFLADFLDLQSLPLIAHTLRRCAWPYPCGAPCPRGQRRKLRGDPPAHPNPGNGRPGPSSCACSESADTDARR